MDYCIYKTMDDKQPRVIHTFTQKATKSKAKVTAKNKLLEMWARVIARPDQFRDLSNKPDEFSYTMQLNSSQTVRVRFYIDKKIS